MKKAPPAPTQQQLSLNFSASAEVRVIPQADGGVLIRPGKILARGTVQDASRTLSVSTSTIITLIEEGAISAQKAREGKPRKDGRKPNTKYIVDMTSVYAHKQRLREAAEQSHQ